MTAQRFPLTLAQQDIYFDQLRQPDSPKYNVGGYAGFKGLDVERFAATYEWLMTHHDGLWHSCSDR